MMEELLSSRPGSQGHSPNPSEDKPGINFTMFLTMMSERLVEFDTEPELIEAFESFDENDTGLIKVEEMRKWLSEVGERMDQREVSWEMGVGRVWRWEVRNLADDCLA